MAVWVSLSPWLGDYNAMIESSCVYAKTKLVVTVLLFRFLYLSAMAFSSHVLVDHDPGDDVLRFDMRLNDINNCYCMRDHACDTGIQELIIGNSTGDCAIPSFESGSIIPPNVWNIILAPLTKWDAARFLSLAINPSLREPKQPSLLSSPSLHSFKESEKAHAFLPMFPWIIQQFSLYIYLILPAELSPPTYESLVVFAGMCLNNLICTTVTTLALYHLTTFLVESREVGKINENGKHHRHFVAAVVCLVFGVWNPALVFFATNYSESFFAASTILGHHCIQRSKSNCRTMLWFAGIACWMIGSYTRSNGAIHCLWLLQDVLARVSLLLCHKRSTDQQCEFKVNARISRVFLLCQVITICIQNIMGAILVYFPARYHDFMGWKRHCVNSGVRPSWCSYGFENQFVLNSSFSLYRHVQAKHWNVGLFHYYRWEQIPNFILAAPILALGMLGVYRWIHWALTIYFFKDKVLSAHQKLFTEWPVHALSESVSVSSESIVVYSSKYGQTKAFTHSHLLLENPSMLGYYAVLAIVTFLGLTIAHVQISTRMICSTSPAIIWFISYCILTLPPNTSHENICTQKFKENMLRKNRLFCFIVENRQKLLWFYAGLFMFLGATLHVNFLPWT